ncbi:MAG: response regulator [Aminivibrio sp.]|jgi:CheY-like chemotaxis protein
MEGTQNKTTETDCREDLEIRIGELEEALRRAEESAKNKSAFMASLSYEIRTPLNSIIGVAGLFQGTRLDLEQKKFVEMLSSSAKDLLGLVEELLDLSLIETGRLTLKNDPFPVRAICSRTIHPMAVSVQERRLSLELRVDPGVPEYLRGDGARLAQILRNMVGNAIAFTPKGTVSVRVFLEEETDASAVLVVQVTHPFEKDGNGKERGEISPRPGSGDGESLRSSGMDLLIAEGVAASMGGGVTVSGLKPGERSIFFRASMEKILPEEENRPAAAAGAAVSRPGAGSLPDALSIMVVDDNRFNRSLTRTILRKMGGPGWKISLAEGGREALALMEGERPDLILMDVQMPEMDGLECTRTIRDRESRAGQKPVAIVAMTAYAMEGDRQKCLDAGMDDYIAKPVEAEKLREIIGKNLPQSLRTSTPSAD